MSRDVQSSSRAWRGCRIREASGPLTVVVVEDPQRSRAWTVAPSSGGYRARSVLLSRSRYQMYSDRTGARPSSGGMGPVSWLLVNALDWSGRRDCRVSPGMDPDSSLVEEVQPMHERREVAELRRYGSSKSFVRPRNAEISSACRQLPEFRRNGAGEVVGADRPLLHELGRGCRVPPVSARSRSLSEEPHTTPGSTTCPVPGECCRITEFRIRNSPFERSHVAEFGRYRPGQLVARPAPSYASGSEACPARAGASP